MPWMTGLNGGQFWMDDSVNTQAGQAPSGMTAEEQEKWKQMQLQLEQAKASLEGTRASEAEAQRKLSEGPEIKYNPVQEKDGKISLRDEFQDKGAGALIDAEQQKLATQQGLEKDDLASMLSQNLSNQRASIASRGGLKGQSAALLGRFNMRDALLAQQKLGQQQAGARSDLGLRGVQLQRESELRNLENLGKGAYYTNAFDLDKWKKNKEVEASKISADATRSAGGGGGKK
jgi:hypothetical protein